MWVLHSVLGLAVAGALGAAGWRLASRLRTDDPVVRVLAAVVWWWLGVEVAGLATTAPTGLGPGPVGAAVAAAAAGLVLRFVPQGRPTAAPDDPSRVLVLTVGAGVLALGAIGLLRPVIGFDGLLYHLAVPAAWIGDGHLASLPRVVDGLPVEAYPVGTELTTAWILAVTGSTAAALLLTPVALGVTALAVWTLTRRVGGSVAACWGAVASTALALPFLAQASQVSTDVAGAALMACGATIVLDAAGRSGAGGADRVPVAPDVAGLLTGLVGLLLALGVKTTAACGGLLFLVLAWPARRALLGRVRAAPWWGAAVLVAGGCGGLWLVRNLVLHGHPAWPLLASDSGDPVPPILRPTVTRFVDHPGDVLRAGGTTYLDLAWVVLPLVAIGIVAVARGGGRRRVVALCGVLGALAWLVAPGTGTTSDPALAAGATRYLMPAWVLLAAAGWATLSGPAPLRSRALAVAWAAGVVALVQLALAWRYAADLEDGPLVDLDRLPIEHGLVAALVSVAVLGVLLVHPGRPGVVLGRPPAGAAVTVLGALLVLLATPGLWDRHATTLDTGEPPEPDAVVLALGATPAWALGPHGAPGSRLVADCEALRGGLAAGRTVTIGPGRAGRDRCGLPGEPVEVDGFLVWTPPGD